MFAVAVLAVGPGALAEAQNSPSAFARVTSFFSPAEFDADPQLIQILQVSAQRTSSRYIRFDVTMSFPPRSDGAGGRIIIRNTVNSVVYADVSVAPAAMPGKGARDDRADNSVIVRYITGIEIPPDVDSVIVSGGGEGYEEGRAVILPLSGLR